MTIKINAPRIIRAHPDTYKLIVRGRKNTLPNKLDYAVGDQIRIKEHTGYRYTGRETSAEVIEATDEAITFKKWSITHDEELEKKNKRDEHSKTYTTNKWNAYV